jgi:uroporphyrin-III C-methyltransferase
MARSTRIDPGTVYLVGAGPGDPGLLTVRALQLIRNADVVLHDRLVGADVLAECGSHAVRIDVGKSGHGPAAEQGWIEQQLVTLAGSGLRVVRLKGGDPFVFGRGAEEAAALRAAGIPFEIVPGVSSAIAAPAYAGIPVTARGVARSVAIVTGHCAATTSELPAIPNADTVVVLMGVANAAAVRDQMVASGRSGDTPVAVIEHAASATQRVAVGTLASLPDLVAINHIQPPAVIVVGDVVTLRSALDWFDPARAAVTDAVRPYAHTSRL